MNSAEAALDRRRAWGLGCGSLVAAALVLGQLAGGAPGPLRALATLILVGLALAGIVILSITDLARRTGLGRGPLVRLEWWILAWISRFAKDREGFLIYLGGWASDTELGMECLRHASPMGPRGAFEYGLALREGPAKDLAIPWFRAAAERGHPEAMLSLAEALRWGGAGEGGPEEARLWEQRASAYPGTAWRRRSQLRSDQDLDEQIGAKVDGVWTRFEGATYELAKRPWFPYALVFYLVLLLPVSLMAIRGGYVGIGIRGVMVSVVCLTPVVFSFRRLNKAPKGVRRHLEQAEQGNPTAALELARVYLTGGQGLPKDALSAMLWFRRAAEGGEVEAMASVADMLASGHGVVRDLKQARQWFEQAGKAGHGGAAAWLAQHPDL